MERHGKAAVTLLVAGGLTFVCSESWTQPKKEPKNTAPYDAVMDAQTPKDVPVKRPEQKKTSHDQPENFSATKAEPSSTEFTKQPEEGKISGFDFYRDPLNAKKPMTTTFEEVYKADLAEKQKVADQQRRYLESHYNLTPNLSPDVTMTRGKPIAVGPTARLPQGTTWEQLAVTSPEAMRQNNLFPYPPLPHPKQVAGGQVFPQMQIDMFPRLQRFDVDFDIPDAFLPEFPPAIFLQNRPELGDVSQGEVVSINNYYRLFKDLLTPVQLDGLRMLLTPFPQEEFNPTDDRKSPQPSLGVACLDCHVNGHTTGQFHLSPDIRPQERRFRLDTTSLRGLFNQQIHGSKRSLRSVEDFTEFEQRTAYFNGDEIHAAKKGMNIISRVQVAHMAQMQNMFGVPPAPKLDTSGRLDPKKATPAELAGQKVFFEKGKCGNCHIPPFYMDQQMHDLKMERFTREPGDGPIKTFTLRGIKESPPYMHDGRCLTLEDTVEFFNLVLELKLTKEEKANLVAFMRVL
ncbi:cytochrome B6 [Geobacter sp. SVR]|uniref:cytochrome B6 n=1 Tax=Geobacter sp. SVR TaxID=2495594 RepID=UPI00143EF8B8|nr:cytochrome B6 [Geobacter sp. SVR]BCS53881.1 cytochrome b6 [Geobacter sp. SVR]GCF85610.1 cytochrome b6 [Geobacter sp. SVR]